MIKFENVTKIYNAGKKKIKALQNVSFEVGSQEFASVVGKSGAGKSTILRLLIGEEDPTSGVVSFRDKNVKEMDSEELQQLRREIGVVHQDYKLLFSRTVKENVEYIMEVIGATYSQIQRDVPEVLDLVGLERRKASFPSDLSGGEKQRLAVARALCHRPEVIAADEPTGNLDIYNTFEIIKTLKKIHKLGTTVLLFTHDKEIIDNLDKRTITLEKGKLIRDEQKGRFII